MKQPVPKVFFAMPGRVHNWPNSAACWSPTIARIGTSAPNSSAGATPNAASHARISGNTDAGTSNSFSSSGSHACVRRFISDVRLALVTSVACTAPPVSFHSSQVSTVPAASSPFSARARAPGT